MDVSPTLVVPADAWLTDADRLRGEWQGGSIGSGICVIANKLDSIGGGPRLHRHPYPEVIFVRAGRALVSKGERQVIATARDLVFFTPHPAHKLVNHRPGTLESIDIHEHGSFITEWLEQPVGGRSIHEAQRFALCAEAGRARRPTRRRSARRLRLRPSHAR